MHSTFHFAFESSIVRRQQSCSTFRDLAVTLSKLPQRKTIKGVIPQCGITYWEWMVFLIH